MLSAGVLACSFLFISAPWLTVSLSAAESATSRVVVTGAAAVPVLIGLILAYLAAMIVATLVHPIVRNVALGLGVFLAGTGVGIVVALVVSPLGFVRASISRVTGISDVTHQAGVVTGISVDVWPVVTAAVLIVGLAGGVMALWAAPTWRAGPRKYERRAAAEEAGSPRDLGRQKEGPTSDTYESWDKLTLGGDPTGISKD
ncbi:unannotated protein [freshwater metagenome]|uniref:Unannotated protein n=1 Tax=freshwater metagenome TaxID=449393 RepID=A0A6J7G5X7_9ZZZZ